MRLEKKDNQINYWGVIDDGLPLPLIVGVEHREGLLSGIQLNNPNTGKVVTLSGVELEAVAKVFNESGLRIEQSIPDVISVV